MTLCTGLYLHESGVLGASPDAVTSECTIEIKCPYSYRSQKLEDVLVPAEKYALSFVNGCTVVNRAHNYYYQVQSQIHFSKRAYGILIAWTTKGYLWHRIEKDDEWTENNIPRLLYFYRNFYLPYLASSI